MTKAQKANKNLRNENCAYKVSDRNKDILGIGQRAIHDILAKILSTSCQCSQTLCEAVFKCGALNKLADIFRL